MRRTASLLLMVILFSAPLAADTYPRQPGVDIVHYVFRVTLSDSTDEISGETTVDIRFVNEGVSEVALDLTSNMKVSAITAGDSAVHYTRDGNRLRLDVNPAPKADAHRQFTIQYRGIPMDGLRISKNKYGDRTFFSENWPDKARQWLPTLDHPYDKATSEFIITAPAHYQVVANGLLQEESDLGGGLRRTHWKQSIPIPTWLNAIGVAEFASRHFGSIKGIPLQTWVFHQNLDAGIGTFEQPTRQALEFYIDHIGPYPYEKLADVQVAGSSGGMEHASAIFYGEATVTGRPATGLVAHEIAHQWFGDSVTENDWDDVWLSEGFATYFTLLVTEHYQGRDAFVAGLKRSRDTVFSRQKQMPEKPIIHENLSDMSKVLNQLVYQKGGWVLHMLRGVVGPEKFWAGIQEYYKRYRDGNASTDDFRHVMEDASDTDLAWFFKQWLNRPGWPVIEGTWRYNANSKRAEVELTQTQAGEAYRVPLEIAINAHVERIEMLQKQQRFEILSDQEPSSVTLDPNTWLLAESRLLNSKRP